MAKQRNGLADKLEIVGRLFEIDGMADIFDKFTKSKSVIQFNAVVIQISGLLMKEAPDIADKLISANRGISPEEVDNLEDGEYSLALKDAITGDVLGFFASYPHTGGKK